MAHAAKTVVYNRIVFVLSLIGIVMAVYVLQSFLRQTSIVCLNSGCEIVRKSPLSYPLGIPVPAVGLVGYGILSILAFLRTTGAKNNLLYPILGLSAFGVAFVSWFTFTELFLIKAVCTWCAVSAVNMLVIFSISLLMYKEAKK